MHVLYDTLIVIKLLTDDDAHLYLPCKERRVCYQHLQTSRILDRSYDRHILQLEESSSG